MFKKIKSYLMVAVMSLSFGAPVMVPAMVGVASAECSNGIQTNVGAGADAASSPSVSTCTPTSGDGSTGLSNIAKKITNLFSLIVGAIAIIMIIYGGFRYITSGGDSGKVGSAKNTLIYAIIGLIIVALAQLIVRFVLTQTNSTTNGNL
jgi:hypothetical protein